MITFLFESQAFVVTASVITTVPMILLFFVGQRYFVQGISTTG